MADDTSVVILIVEDDLITALNERETLEAKGYSIMTARSGSEAVSLTEANASINLVLMDIDLGAGMDGIEAATIIARISPRPTLFFSSHTDSATLERLNHLDAYGIVAKDSGDAVLCTSVALALRRVAAERAAIESSKAEQARHAGINAMRLKETHHRIRNNIASISAIMSMQLRSANNPETVSALQDAIGRIEGMGALYEMLSGDEHGSEVPVKPYIERLVETLASLFPNASRVATDIRIDEFSLDPKRLFALGIIVNELLTNMMKYAFSGRDSGSAALDIIAGNETVMLTLRDDGNGLPDDFAPERSSGLGISLISMLLEQFGGTLSMRNDNGTTSTVLMSAPGLRASPLSFREAASSLQYAVA